MNNEGLRMTPDVWWKNFGLGQEIDIGGAYIYDGIMRLHKLQSLQHSVDIFQVLYDLSIGIERIAKVAIILLEHRDDASVEDLEESLITHNTQKLIDRINDHSELGLSNLHREFLHLVSKFYKTHRYDRYTRASVPEISKEKEAFLGFFGKHLGIDVGETNEFQGIKNTDQIRRFVGKVVKRITDAVFSVIKSKTSELNIYTHELRGDSKAIRVFYGKRLDFIYEEIKRKEILLFLINPSSNGRHISLLREFGSLQLDPGMTGSYIKALFDDNELRYVEGEIEELYSEISDVNDRLGFLGIIDSEYLAYDPDEDS